MADNLHYSTTGKPHPYHMVRPSPWPFIGACAGGLLAVGMLMYMHSVQIGGMAVGLKGVIAGLASVASVMFFWWRTVVQEATVEKAHSPVAKIGLRYGMALFIASEVMFFVAFFWAFYDASLYAADPKQVLRNVYTGGMWPPPTIQYIHPFDLPFLMTMLLLLSGCTVTWAHHEILEGRRSEVLRGLAVTILLGACFLGFQSFEYMHAKFGFHGGIYPSTFFMATGFHGFHVFVGTVFLIVCWFRAKKNHFTPDSHFGFEAAAWYWHFVDVVWLFLFISIYFWGNTIGTGHM